MRLSRPGLLRFGQAGSFDVIYGGGEANVAVSLANFGVPVNYVAWRPENDLGEVCIQSLRQCGVGVGKIVREAATGRVSTSKRWALCRAAAR